MKNEIDDTHSSFVDMEKHSNSFIQKLMDLAFVKYATTWENNIPCDCAFLVPLQVKMEEVGIRHVSPLFIFHHTIHHINENHFELLGSAYCGQFDEKFSKIILETVNVSNTGKKSERNFQVLRRTSVRSQSKNQKEYCELSVYLISDIITFHLGIPNAIFSPSYHQFFKTMDSSWARSVVRSLKQFVRTIASSESSFLSSDTFHDAMECIFHKVGLALNLELRQATGFGTNPELGDNSEDSNSTLLGQVDGYETNRCETPIKRGCYNHSETNDASLTPTATFSAENQWLWDNEEMLRDGMESYVLSRVFPHCFPQHIELDRRFEASISAIDFKKAHSDLAVPHELSEMRLWKEALIHFRSINTFIPPKDKLMCIVNSSKSLLQCLKTFQEMNHLALQSSCDESTSLSQSNSTAENLPEIITSTNSKTTDVGADEFLPAFLLLVAKARTRGVASNVFYIKEYRSPERITGEESYFLTCVHSAIEYWTQATYQTSKTGENQVVPTLCSTQTNESGRKQQSGDNESRVQSHKNETFNIIQRIYGLIQERDDSERKAVEDVCKTLDEIPSHNELKYQQIPDLFAQYRRLRTLELKGSLDARI